MYADSRHHQTLAALWGTFNSVGTTVGGWVNNIVDAFLVPAVKQKWEAIVSAVSSIVGVLIFIFIIVDAMTDGSSTGIAVAVIVGITDALGAAANFKNGFWTAEPDDTYLTYTGNFDQGIGDYTAYMINATSDLWDPANPAGVGAQVVQKSMAGGSWTSIGNPFGTIDHLQDNMEYFFDGLLGSSLINEIMKYNNGWYLVFVPYGTVTDWMTTPESKPGTIQFTADDCNNHWANDPKRPNYIDCTLNYGGEAGMTILTEAAPKSKTGVLLNGGGTLSLSENCVFSDPDHSFTFSLSGAMQASLTGNANYGFNYNYTTDQLESDVTSGAVELNKEFQGLAQSTPGLYNLDVCVLTQMSYIPGARQWMLSNNADDYFWPDPCACASFQSHGQTFGKVASSAAVNATTTDANGLVCTSVLQNQNGLASNVPDSTLW